MIIAVKLVFTLATLLFAIGFAMRIRNNPLHRKLMVAGFLCTLGIAVVLVVGVYIFGGTYAPAAWLTEMTGSVGGAKIVLLTHRAVATITLVVLIVQVVTGLRRHPLHKRLFKAVIPLWAITYVSGLIIFV